MSVREIFAIRTSIKPGWATRIYIFDLIACITITLVDYPAGRPGWTSPLFLAMSIWIVSLFCRWPIPDEMCDCETEICQGSQE